MPDAVAPAPAPTTPAAPPSAPSAPSAARASADDAALFGKFTAQHQKAVAEELGKDANGQSSNEVRGRGAAVAARSEGAGATGAPGSDAGGEDAGTERDATGGETDDAGAASGGRKTDAAPAAVLSESDAIALARKAHAAGDLDELDRALKAILPGSKGIAEFNVDGKRYGEFRAASARRARKLDDREATLGTREQNLQRGMSVLEQVVQRLEPIEQLVKAAEDDSPAGVAKFVELIEKVTRKPINETLKRHLNHKLDKPGDPEVEALRRELNAERTARQERERKEAEARQQQARTQEIQRHLVFLDQTLGAHADPAVRELVKSRDGIAAIFRAQESRYNPQTRTTISPEQAAKLVLAERSVLGGSKPAATPPANGDGKQEPSTQTPAPASNDRARSLGSRGSAPASPGTRRLSDAELFEKYERLAKIAGD